MIAIPGIVIFVGRFLPAVLENIDLLLTYICIYLVLVIIT